MCRIQIFLFLIFIPLYSSAQHYTGSWEAGLFLGVSNYLGDLAPDIAVNETHPAAGFFLKRNSTPYVTWSLDARYGVISGHDANFPAQRLRNLSFRSNILEVSPKFELNFFRFRVGLGTRKITPFVYTGIAAFYFDPQAKLNGEWHDLAKLSTEGQGIVQGAPKPYRQIQLAIPIGAGVKIALNDNLNITIHGDFNSAFTDYLDDVSRNYVSLGIIAQKKGAVAAALSDRSGEVNAGENIGRPGYQRGTTDTQDWYIFAGTTLSYVFPGRRCYKFRH